MRVVLVVMLWGLTSLVHADSTTRCRVDSGGNRICVERDRETGRRCTQTCRRDSGGNLVCKERCR